MRIVPGGLLDVGLEIGEIVREQGFKADGGYGLREGLAVVVEVLLQDLCSLFRTRTMVRIDVSTRLPSTPVLILLLSFFIGSAVRPASR